MFYLWNFNRICATCYNRRLLTGDMVKATTSAAAAKALAAETRHAFLIVRSF